MNCEHVRSSFSEYLTGEISESEKSGIQDHIKSCPDCREELHSLNRIWINLGVLPEEQPSQNLRNNFYTMLESYKQGMEDKKAGSGMMDSLARLFEKIWPARPLYQFGLSLAILLMGFWIGYLIPGSSSPKAQLSQLRGEMDQMREFVSMTLLKQQSPVDRLKGITLSASIRRPDRNTLQALLDILNTDSNVNVRLSAVDALYLFTNNPLVKDGLIASLAKQTSPLVQVAIVDLITEMRETRAVKALKKLINRQNLNPEVKERIESSIAKLI